MWILLVKPWRRLSRNFSHVLAMEAKKDFWQKSCGTPISKRWIVFSLGRRSLGEGG
jgi:hypothetical protein